MILFDLKMRIFLKNMNTKLSYDEASCAKDKNLLILLAYSNIQIYSLTFCTFNTCFIAKKIRFDNLL